MNKDILIQCLADCNPILKDEINYYLNEVEHEEDYNIIDAFTDAADMIENEGRLMQKYVFEVYVKCGYCVVVDPSKVYVTHGKKYWFYYDKKPYDCVESWESWINK